MELLLIPGALLVLAVLLSATEYAESHVLAPRSMILYGVRSKRLGPEQAELLVTAQAEALLERAARAPSGRR